MHFKSKKVVLMGGRVIMDKKIEIVGDNESFMKSNMIMGKIMKPAVQNQRADQTSVVGGDIMDFAKAVKRNVRNLQKRKEEENIKFIY